MIGLPAGFRPPPLVFPTSKKHGGRPAPLGFSLDPFQQGVVDWRRGEAVCAAAAGSGKTTILVERIVRLLHEGEPPEGLLTLTFNKDAAETFEKRLTARLHASGIPKKAAERVPVYTFHAWSLALLRTWFPGDVRWKNILGGQARADRGGPKLPTKASLWFQALNGVRGTLKKGEELQHGQDWKWWADLYDRSRDAGMGRSKQSIHDFLESKFCGSDGIDDETGAIRPMTDGWSFREVERATAVFDLYEASKDQHRAIDFCDMTAFVGTAIDLWSTAGRPATHAVQMTVLGGGTVVQEQAHPVEALRSAYRHVQCDEAQDSNGVRWKIALHLGSGAKSMVSCGDARQSLYSFAGAVPQNFIDRIEAGAALLTLPVNRRSTARIVEHGNTICRGRKWHLGGDAVAKPGAPEGAPVAFNVFRSAGDEARWVASRIAQELTDRVEVLKRGKATPATYGVVCRTNAALIAFEVALTVRKIPCYVRGKDGGIWETEPGRELRGLLAGAEGIPHDCLYDGAIKIGRYTKKGDLLDALKDARAGVGSYKDARTGGGPYDGSYDVRSPDVRAHLRNRTPACQRLAGILHGWGAKPWAERCTLVCKALSDLYPPDEAGAADGNSEIDDRRECYAALCEAAQQLGSLAALEEAAAIARKAAESGEAVVLGTGHRWKGAEAPVVFVPRVEKGQLPHKKSDDEEEERRIYYVACTRAMERLYVSCAAEPSPFLPEDVYKDWLRLHGREREATEMEGTL